MKKTLLAGTFLIILLVLIVYSGRIAEFSWGGRMPGRSPVELWVRHVSGEIKVEERFGKVILTEVSEDTIFVTGINNYGADLWQESWEGRPMIYFDQYFWSCLDQSQGTINLFDYHGKLVRRVDPPVDYKYFWPGPEGEILFSRGDSSEKDRLEGMYGEKGVVFNNQGEMVFEESFAGMGILDMRLLPGTENLIISLVEIFPYHSSKVLFSTLEGEKLSEIRSNQLFFPPITLEENNTVVLISGSYLYYYSFTGAPLFNKEWEDPISAAFPGAGDESLLVVITPEQFLKEETRLICLSLEGNILWEKELPGGYRQGKSRKDGGILIETDLFLYLLHPDGNTLGYYSPEEGQKINLLSTDTFITFERGRLTAYSWPIK